ncbi:craniofacial development protein 2-like [Penaeus japonicus]|uniref:craniofacial development protein 2-like n=1 Tax=Penaeus japonicus TaxID=27405 RepID=UPI001C70D876|nr:craniofacial development protein 2-like [Penaeus japonicus]
MSQAYADHHPATVTKHPRNLRTIRNKKHCIATWNIRTLYQQGKLDNVILEMDRLKLDVLGLGEVRWVGVGQFVKGDKTVLYSGGDQHHHEVVLILNKQFSKSAQAIWQQSDRILLVKLKTSPFNVNIVVAYSPTADSNEDEIDMFYDDLEAAHNQCKCNEVNIIMGDFNAKNFTGHVIRKGELEDLSLVGKIPGKKARGGRRLLFLNQLKENTGSKTSRKFWDAARSHHSHPRFSLSRPLTTAPPGDSTDTISFTLCIYDSTANSGSPKAIAQFIS